jgi:YD repeat-containing protein
MLPLRHVLNAPAGLATGARNIVTAVPHGVAVAGRLKGTLGQRATVFGRAVRCRFLGRDPVDLATGEMVLTQVDARLPAASLPLVVSRTHTTSYRAGRLFGPAWSSPLDQRLEVDDTGVYYSSEDGVVQRFPVPADGAVYPDEGERVELRAGHDQTYTVTDPRSGTTLHFGRIAGAETDMFLLVRLSDRNTNTVEFDYADGGVLRTIRHFGGYVLDVTTTGDGWATALTLRGTEVRDGQVLVRYAYDDAGRLTEVINSSQRPLRFEYDGWGRIVGWIDRNGAWYRYTYDGAGRCVATEGSDGILNGWIIYDARTTVETNSLGHATTYEFNEAYQVQRVVDPLGNATAMTWDRYNRLLSRTDPLGHTTHFAYDEVGNLTRVDRADGTRLTATFNRLNRPVIVTGPDGATWRHEYDERGNLTSVVDPARARTSYRVDEHGHVVSMTDATGQVTWVVNNAAGLPVAITDPTGATTTCRRDGLGRITDSTNPLGATTRQAWTVEGRLASRSEPDGATETWAYDAEGNLVEHTTAVGAVTRWRIIGFDQIGERVDPDSSRMTFGYDTELRLVSVTNPQGLVWRYEFDAAGRLIRETDFNDRTIAFQFDAAGRTIGRTNAVGQSVHLRRDPLGRVIESDADGSVTSFRYDQAGRLVAVTSADAALALHRDALGRVVAETCNGRTVASEYDPLGRRTAVTTPSGARTEWSYDSVGRPHSMRSGRRLVHFGRDALGRETRRVVGPVTLAQSWDTNSRLVAQAVTGSANRLVQRRTFTYRPDGQVSAIDDILTGGRRYELDLHGRVTAVQGPDGWRERYDYDAAGNLTHAHWPADAETAETTGAREYTGSRVHTAGGLRFEHDEQGRVVLRQRKVRSARSQNWRYTWDAHDRLVAVTTPDGTRWR